MNVENFKDTFAENLRIARERKKISQKELAQIISEKHGIKLTAASVSGYETGKSLPQLNVAAIIAEELGTSLDELCAIKRSSGTKTLSDVINHLICANSSPQIFEISSIKVFENEQLKTFLKDWEKMQLLYDNGSIDDELFQFWLDKESKKYKNTLL